MQIKRLLHQERGQDVVEYALLLAFLALGSAGLFFSSGGSLQGIWGAADSELAVANGASSADSSAKSTTGSGTGGDRHHHGGGHGGGHFHFH